jgi:hypothetical protein
MSAPAFRQWPAAAGVRQADGAAGGRLQPPLPARRWMGEGLGTYPPPLAGRGYRVHVVDPPALHVEQARQAR